MVMVKGFLTETSYLLTEKGCEFFIKYSGRIKM